MDAAGVVAGRRQVQVYMHMVMMGACNNDGNACAGEGGNGGRGGGGGNCCGAALANNTHKGQ